MALNVQCWGCRWRRVRCDAQQPSCLKCTSKGLSCPGYSTVKPLKWRHRITQPQSLHVQTLQPKFSNFQSKDEFVSPQLAHETITYCALPRCLTPELELI